MMAGHISPQLHDLRRGCERAGSAQGDGFGDLRMVESVNGGGELNGKASGDQNVCEFVKADGISCRSRKLIKPGMAGGGRPGRVR